MYSMSKKSTSQSNVFVNDKYSNVCGPCSLSYTLLLRLADAGWPEFVVFEVVVGDQ